MSKANSKSTKSLKSKTTRRVVVKLAETNPVKCLHWGDMEFPLREIHGLAAGLELMADGIRAHDNYMSSAVSAVAGALADHAKMARGIFYTAAGEPDLSRAFLDGGEEGGAS